MNLKTIPPSTPHRDSITELNPSVVPLPPEPIVVEYEQTPSSPSALPQDYSENKTEALRYDPVAIEAQYGRAPLQVLGRLLRITLPTAAFAINLWWDRKWGRRPIKERRRAIQLRELLTQLGPAYIKVGQALSTRPDLVPPIYLEELALLQDQLPPFPNEVAFRFIEEELGARPEEIYAELTPSPVAAASLGQVYKGKLKTGETVAVKVQRPGLARRIALDVYILRRLAQWVQSNIKRVRSDLVAIMDEFGTRIFEEMDYTQEGCNAERFANLYGHLQDIYVPKIYWEYTGRRVLTMEWISGTKLTNLEAIKAQGIDAKYLIEVGVQCSLRQLLEHGFFHADPHPGNLLATPEGKLAYLDFGMMSEVKPYQRYGLIEAVVHLVNRDFAGLAHDYVNLEFLTPDTDLTPIIPALANVFSNALGASVAELNFKSITDQLSEVMYEYPFRVPAYYALIIRSLVTLEGIAINVDPNFKVLSKAYPYVAKRLLTDSSPQLRASLKDLLVKDGNFRWNRLENLLRNAANSQDYDLNKVLNQTLEFLFSERGSLIREQLIEEIIKAVDMFGRRTFDNVTESLRQRVGLQQTTTSTSKVVELPQSAEHIKRIWQILQDTPGFDPFQLAPLVPQLLMKPETQQMGQKIAGGLAQRVMARLIREVLLQETQAQGAKPSKGSSVKPVPKLVLPPAAAIH
ncbi:ABC1 kinase family protein [Coleofasciculus sp. G2-EDA-02]|uniref:ABC1 kinase family protein n=1 Tax=Coleofasciculus sp. G2-EDA-02 TaxID=3069529 RepID=UPI0032F3778D